MSEYIELRGIYTYVYKYPVSSLSKYWQNLFLGVHYNCERQNIYMYCEIWVFKKYQDHLNRITLTVPNQGTNDLT